MKERVEPRIGSFVVNVFGKLRYKIHRSQSAMARGKMISKHSRCVEQSARADTRLTSPSDQDWTRRE